MKLQNHSIIKHRMYMDLAIRITKPVLRFPNKVVIRGEYLNMAFVETYPIGQRCNIEIPIEKLNEWLGCMQPQTVCIRYSLWEPLT